MVDADLLLYRLAFASVRGMTVTLARELLRLCGSEKEFFEMSETQLRNLTQSSASIYSAAYRAQKLRDAQSELRFVTSHSVSTLYFTDESFPRRLLECEDAPVLLYGSGATDLNNCHTIGIVGTRHATAYGIEFTRRLVDDLARMVENPVIVSGLAYGIDVAAHRAAIAAGIPTVAVMATGISTIYPADHRSTAVDIVRRGGMLLTEYSSAEAIHKGNFVARNRIVAGLCDCLVVSESAAKGGALITANLAAGYNRDVFALPGRIGDKYSAGCNRIIGAGMAQLISGADDLIDSMGWTRLPSVDAPVQNSLPLPLNPAEEIIVKFLESNEDASLSQLTAATGMGVAKLMSTLIDMEFRGLLLSLPGARYRLS